MYTEEVNKIALSGNDDKRLQKFEGLQHVHMEQMFLKYVLTVKYLFFEKLQWNSATTINVNDKLWWLC